MTGRSFEKFLVCHFFGIVAFSCRSTILAFRPHSCPPTPQQPIRDLKNFANFRLDSVNNNDEDLQTFPDDLVHALDLAPIMRLVASYCGTYRGQQALLRLVGQDDKTVRGQAATKNILWQPPSRKRQLYEDSTVQQQATIGKDKDLQLVNSDIESAFVRDSSWQRIKICPIASSGEEVMDEFSLIAEAAQCLRLVTNKSESFPPVYPADLTNGPFDLPSKNRIMTDDDEFLHFSGTMDDRWTLEQVIHADQVVVKLIAVYEWSTRIDFVKLSTLVVGANDTTSYGMDVHQLQIVWKSIHDSVEIVRVQTLIDARGHSSYQFRLSNKKFPMLGLIRDRHSQLQEELQVHQRSNKFGNSAKSTELAKSLLDCQQDLLVKEREIQSELIQAIYSMRHVIDHGLDVLAKIDIIFAKAAFSIAMHASSAPAISTSSLECINMADCIHVEKFVHPLLGHKNDTKAIPIDLLLGKDYQALVITGSNGGGKSVAMKSFGLVSILAKLAIPIVADSIASVKYFDEILVSVGDYQDLDSGESTFTSQLVRYASLIEKVSSNKEKSYLVLVDELGAGTEEVSGGAIGQAILEKLMESKCCFTVVTTHSPLIKTWSFNCANVECAAVLLQNIANGIDSGLYRQPSYQLQYGCIGESYAFGAASQYLPNIIVSRASEILSDVQGFNSSMHTSYILALTESLEKQTSSAAKKWFEIETIFHDAAMVRTAMILLANSYDKHLFNLEQRVELCFQSLRKQQNSDDEAITEQVLGKTLLELRIVQAVVKQEQELLQERGLKRLCYDYKLSLGESVVIIDECSPWNGYTGTVVSKERLPYDQQEILTEIDVAVVCAEFPWDDFHHRAMEGVGDLLYNDCMGVKVFKQYQLAVWDFTSVWEDKKPLRDVTFKSISDSRRRLRTILSSLNTENSQPRPSQQSLASLSKQPVLFTSSRERKSARQKKKKK